MKSVIIVRHTKSDWSHLLPDFERPVREDRKMDAHLIAQEIAIKNSVPQHIICSSAIRTHQTAEMLSKHWGFSTDNITLNRALYECSAKDILAVIKNVGSNHDSIAIVCHNPAITDFINIYSDTNLANVPTTGAIHITFDTAEWKNVKGKGKVNWILFPKELKKEDINLI